ncbi:penicillin-binding protein 2 [Gluconobacter wancherniae]|uniref:penicillin-binding protein 2 n=1 Tax=Gluconobacter wancherniae TaxID=1307955 RepID=UPI001B8AF142|nr:penicillin-binding protein 2 [Gluconobacter wancherniae]MBS1087686.1 penicillin-binding protein 2 [Gluconobacter wancherniae]MBS1093368.1 penicillin-binding protein 2 [Gluconobacter wancherniae]
MFFKRRSSRKVSRLGRPAEPVRSGRGVFTRRALLVMAVQAGVLGTLGRRLYNLQVVDGGHLRQLAERNRTSKRLLAPARGPVHDRFGIPLADNKVSWRALLMPEETTDIPAVIERFSQIVPLDEHDRARIERDLRHLHKYVPVTLHEFLSWDDMARIELNAPSLPGVLVDVGSTRLYPMKELMAHIVGYVAPPNEDDVAKDTTLSLPGMRVGRAGIEQTQEAVLRGQPGSVEMEVNAVGRVIGEIDREEGEQGDNVHLTLDAVLQQQVLERLGDRVASSVVMDCRNGEILAMVSTPSFDPSLFDSGVSHAQWDEWNKDPRTPLVDKAVSGVYPPGSTFKPAVAMAALQSGAVTAQDRFNCPGYFDMGGVRFHCWNRWGHGMINMREALKYSCDVFFYETARRCGMDPIKAVGNTMGLGVKLGVELPHVRAGLIPTPDWRREHGFHWNGGDTVNAGIGQGFVQVTPLELATYVSRIASGRNVQPHLLRAINDTLSSQASLDVAPPLDIPSEHLDVVRGGMFAVVNEQHGSAPKARLDLPNVQMAGKTGSAQVRHVSRALRESGHFNSMDLPWEYRPHALFICFAPYDEPRYAVSIVVEHGNAGADEAAPLAKLIMTDTLMRDPSNQSRPPGQTVAQAGPEPG